MKYTQSEVLQYVKEEDIKFIRLAFCDVFGRQKNLSILPGELPRAFVQGIPFDGSSIAGFGDQAGSDLLLHPDPDTLAVLPWRPEHGRVVRMFSGISLPDGTDFPGDTRRLLQRAVEAAEKLGRCWGFYPAYSGPTPALPKASARGGGCLRTGPLILCW